MRNTILTSIAFLFIVFSCEQEKKSDLVKRLEGIFYDNSFARIPNAFFSVVDYGAVGDGKTLATEAIQRTIDAAAEKGGGIVIFPKGIYLSGALFVKSNVELNIGKGVVIQAIQDNSHYPRIWTRIAGIEMKWPAALINIYDESNVRITGEGVIDGNGKYWWDKFWGDPPRSGGMYTEYIEKDIRWAVDYDCERVRPIVVWESEDVLLKGFTVQRAGFWTISLTYSNRIHVDGVVVRNNIGGHGPSSDGIDTDSSKDVLVENCDIDCNDDNLCIKAGKDADGLRVNRSAENIVYRNCITRSGHGLITLGSETSGGMRNIEVYGLTALGTNTGIRFKSAKVRGGLIEDIYFHDIQMIDVTNPFNFDLNWYPEYSYCNIPDNIPEKEIKDRWRVLSQRVVPESKGIPEFRNITLGNIVVENAKQAFFANAYPEKPIHHFHWEDITIEAEETGKLSYASDWSMANVVLKTPNGNPIELIECFNIQQPEILKMNDSLTEENKDVRLDDFKSLATNDPEAVIIPISPTENRALADGDTVQASGTLEIHILKQKNSDLIFYEPLGDGFYYSPVRVSVKDNGGTIELKGQKEHEFILIINIQERPRSISNADSWIYDDNKKQVLINKKGKDFIINIF